MNTIAHLWITAEVDDEEVLLSLNYIMLLNDYAEFEEERYLSNEYETLFRSAHSYSKANHLGAWGEVILEEPQFRNGKQLPRKPSYFGIL